MRTLFITLSAIAILTSCSEKKQPIVYENDTEPHDWNGDITIYARPNAHSGKSVSVVDTINPYSLTFEKAIRDLGPEKVKMIKFSYWAYIKNNNFKGSTVLSIDLDGKNLDWQAQPIQAKLKEINKWVEIIETFNISDKIDTKAKVKLFVWNVSKEEILVDDFKISFE